MKSRVLTRPGVLAALIAGSVSAVSCNSGPDVIDVVSPLVTPPDFSAVVSRINLEGDTLVSAPYARVNAILLNQLEAEPGEREPPAIVLVVPKSTRVYLNESRPSLAKLPDIKVGDTIRVWRALNPTDSAALVVPTYTTRQIVVIRHPRMAPQNAQTILVRSTFAVGIIVGPLITLGVAGRRRARRASGTDTAIASVVSEALALAVGALAFGLIGILMVLFPYCADDAIVISGLGAFGGLVCAGVGRSQGQRPAKPYTDWIAGMVSMAPSALVTAYDIVICHM